MDTIKEIVAEMRRVAIDDSADGHYWSQTTGDCVGVEVVAKWADQLEAALDDLRYSDD